MDVRAWALLLVAGIGIAAALEGWRQSRKVGRPSGRPNLLGVGALELQRHLEPERKVEIVLQDTRKEEHTEPGYRPARPADGDLPGPTSQDRNLERP